MVLTYFSSREFLDLSGEPGVRFSLLSNWSIKTCLLDIFLFVFVFIVYECHGIYIVTFHRIAVYPFGFIRNKLYKLLKVTHVCLTSRLTFTYWPLGYEFSVGNNKYRHCTGNTVPRCPIDVTWELWWGLNINKMRSTSYNFVDKYFWNIPFRLTHRFGEVPCLFYQFRTITGLFGAIGLSKRQIKDMLSNH